MCASARRSRGFTLVEVVVVLGIIAVLAGLLLPALGGAQRRAKKMEELTRLREVGQAWLMYSNANDDAALPGFLDASDTPSVMDHWNVRYWYPDRTEILPDPEDAYYAEEWPWRLASYLSYNQDIFIGHLEPTETSPVAMKDQLLIDEDIFGVEQPRPQTISEQPGFGYNAFYTGGWWEMTELPDVDDELPMPRFWNARSEDGTQRVNVIARSPSSIYDTSRYIIFCSSSVREPGEYRGTHPLTPGAHYVVPPILADQPQWQQSALNPDVSVLEVLEENAAPIARYTDQVAVLHADLHSEPHMVGELEDQRYWINGASRPDWQHLP